MAMTSRVGWQLAILLAGVAALAPLAAQNTPAQPRRQPQPPKQQPQKQQPPKQAAPEETSADDSWLPPLVAGLQTVGTLRDSRPAARRGLACAHAGITLDVFGPDSPPGPTSEASPRLFWYILETLESGCDVTFTLMCDPQDQENPAACPTGAPPLEAPVPGPIRPGIHEVKPAPKLQPGIVYRWYISVGRKQDGRSGDDLEGAFIQRIAGSPAGPKPWYDRLADALDLARKGDRGEFFRVVRELGYAPRN